MNESTESVDHFVLQLPSLKQLREKAGFIVQLPIQVAYDAQHPDTDPALALLYGLDDYFDYLLSLSSGELSENEDLCDSDDEREVTDYDNDANDCDEYDRFSDEFGMDSTTPLSTPDHDDEPKSRKYNESLTEPPVKFTPEDDVHYPDEVVATELQHPHRFSDNNNLVALSQGTAKSVHTSASTLVRDQHPASSLPEVETFQQRIGGLLYSISFSHGDRQCNFPLSIFHALKRHSSKLSSNDKNESYLVGMSVYYTIEVLPKGKRPCPLGFSLDGMQVLWTTIESILCIRFLDPQELDEKDEGRENVGEEDNILGDNGDSECGQAEDEEPEDGQGKGWKDSDIGAEGMMNFRAEDSEAENDDAESTDGSDLEDDDVPDGMEDDDEVTDEEVDEEEGEPRAEAKGHRFLLCQHREALALEISGFVVAEKDWRRLTRKWVRPDVSWKGRIPA
jgi:hypothetical protein